MGDIVYMIEYLENALSFDLGDGRVYAQFILLKQQLTEVEALA